MKLKIVFPILVLIALLVSGCTPFTRALKPEQKIKPGNGVFVVAVTKSKKGFNTEIVVKKVGETSQYIIDSYDSTGDTKNDFASSDKEYGRIVVTQVPAGDYIVSNWVAYDLDGSVSPRTPEPIHFSVKPNTVTYIGHYFIKTLYGKNIFGITIRAAATADISDNYANEVGIAKGRYPNIQNLNFTREVTSKIDWK